MSAIRGLARATRRGLFGNRIPAKTWESTLERFQRARDALAKTCLALDEVAPALHDRATYQAWQSVYDAAMNQARVMDGTARGIVAASTVANGLDSLPGFQGMNAFASLGLDAIGAPVTVAGLSHLTAGAWGIVNRAKIFFERSPFPANGLAGAFEAWGSFGGDVWEMLHPGQVQREYEAVGKTAPSKIEIVTGAAYDAARDAREGASENFEKLLKLAKWTAILAGVGVAGIYLAPVIRKVTK